MDRSFENHLLKATSASACREIEVIQSLWSGYGKISRYQLDNSSIKTVVVKCISPNPSNAHPRGWDTDRSHNRKVKSYEVETHWYEQWNHLCTAACRVPEFLGSFSQDENQWIILEDLNPDFPLRLDQIDYSQVKVCLSWLAHFHATFLGQKPTGLLDIGTYWHLATRPDELEKIEHQELKSKAHTIDELLNQCTYQTIVHGDAKLANFCFSSDGQRIAAVDFQYVGGGCGMKDVAYFLGSCLSSSECEKYEGELLNFYFSELRYALGSTRPDLNHKSLEEEWRKMYPLACADFTRFLLGWMPAHQKVNNYNLNILNVVLSAM